MEYKEFIAKVILDFLYSGFWIYIPTQAIVYLAGRMLGILKTDLTKNLLAFVATIGFSYLYIKMNLVPTDIWVLLYMMIHWVSLGIFFYVLLGFQLFNRIDNLLDKKVASDEKPKKKYK